MSIWGSWLKSIEPYVEYRKFQHFEFYEDSDLREQTQNELVSLIHNYHTRSRVDRQLVAALGYPKVAMMLLGDQRPQDPSTRRGHLGEILACEFARYIGFEVPVLRLRYNPNPNQSMKGDDILGFIFEATEDNKHHIIIGESKYRSSYEARVVEEAYHSLANGFRPFPASMEFVSTILELEGNAAKASWVRRLRAQLTNRSPDIQRHYLLFLATQGRPRNPFGIIDSMEERNILQNLIVVNTYAKMG